MPATRMVGFFVGEVWGISSGESGSNFLRIEKEAMTGLTKHTHVPAGIVIQNNANVVLTLVILLDAFDGSGLSRRGRCPLHRHRGAGEDARGCLASLRLPKFRGDRARVFSSRSCHSHSFIAFSSSTGRSPRITPCSFISCSAGKVSVRSSIWRARSSDWLISRFSSSVRVMIRKERISSISVPSNRSPALSGAIWG